MGNTEWQPDDPIQPGYREPPPWHPQQPLIPLQTIAILLTVFLVIVGLLLWAVS